MRGAAIGNTVYPGNCFLVFRMVYADGFCDQSLYK